jgi:hypothetical protein
MTLVARISRLKVIRKFFIGDCLALGGCLALSGCLALGDCLALGGCLVLGDRLICLSLFIDVCKRYGGHTRL